MQKIWKKKFDSDVYISCKKNNDVYIYVLHPQ